MARAPSRSACVAMLSLGMLALAASASHAQYTFDPSAADELDKPG